MLNPKIVEKFKEVQKATQAIRRLARRQGIKALGNGVEKKEEIRRCLKSKRNDAIKKLAAKAGHAYLMEFPDYDSIDLADYCGCDPSRLQKGERDRTGQEVIDIRLLFGLADYYDATICEILDQPTKLLAVTYTLCHTVPTIAVAREPEANWPELRNGILPLQQGLILNHAIRSAAFCRIFEFDWSDQEKIYRLMTSDTPFAKHIQALIERVNKDLRQMPRLQVEQVTIDNLGKHLSCLCFAWHWFLITELMPIEWHDGILPLVGVFNEFHPGFDPGNFYWS